MVDVISVVLAVLQEVVKMANEMEEVGTQAARLARRLADLEGPVKRIKNSVEEGNDIFPARNFRRLENLVTEGHAFLRELKDRNSFRRVMKRRSDLEKFQALTEDTKEVILIFNFELNVQGWEQENDWDQNNDERRLLHIEEMLEKQLTNGFERVLGMQSKMLEEFKSHLREQRTTEAAVALPTTVRAICFSYPSREK